MLTIWGSKEWAGRETKGKKLLRCSLIPSHTPNLYNPSVWIPSHPPVSHRPFWLEHRTPRSHLLCFPASGLFPFLPVVPPASPCKWLPNDHPASKCHRKAFALAWKKILEMENFTIAGILTPPSKHFLPTPGHFPRPTEKAQASHFKSITVTSVNCFCIRHPGLC